MTTQPLQRTAQALALELTRGKANLPAELRTAIQDGGPMDQAQLTPALLGELNNIPSPATFVSTPITGGPRLMQFLEKHDLSRLDGGLPVMTPEQRQAYFQEVIIPNQQHAHEVTAKLRQEGVALESADTELIPGFSNPDYNRQWMDVVSDLKPLQRVVACDGWQFSFGTLLELRAAMDRGVPVQDEHGQAITRDRARTEVQGAIAEASRHGLNFSKLGVIMDESDLRSGPMSL